MVSPSIPVTVQNLWEEETSCYGTAQAMKHQPKIAMETGVNGMMKMLRTLLILQESGNIATVENSTLQNSMLVRCVMLAMEAEVNSCMVIAEVKRVRMSLAMTVAIFITAKEAVREVTIQVHSK